jgi:DNA-binding transcriptional MerR regulator
VTPKLYRAAEVCEAAGLQPYVLRSWEKEFPRIGVQKSADTPRLYRQSDLDQVLRIKQLVFVEGLTLAGARRRLEDELPRDRETAEAEIAEVLDTLGADVRSRIELVRTGLRSILDVLSKRAGAATLAALPSNGSRGKTSVAARQPSKGVSMAARPGTPRRMAAKRDDSGKRTAAAKRTTVARRTKSGKRKRASA